MSQVIRVLVVDDSRMHRKAITAHLQRQAGMEVVGEAADGAEGVQATLRLAPDVVLMDVRMPVLDGLQATQRIMAECPTPILLMTAAENLNQDVDLGLRALEYGALDLVTKPDFEQLQETDAGICSRLRIFAGVPVIRHQAASLHRLKGQADRRTTGYFRRAKRMVAIVSSTGGPKALTEVLSGFPAGMKAAVVIVQHIDAAFEQGLVRWLDEHCRMDVVLGVDDDELLEGRVYLAPQGRYSEVSERRRLRLVDDGPVGPGSHCPSGDRLLHSVSQVYGEKAIGCVLTGIGRDGADGLLALRRAGGLTIAQDAATSVVYGMPQAAAHNGAALRILPLQRIAARIVGAIE